MEKVIIQFISIIIIAISTVLIYDASDIATKHFNKEERYSAIKTLKIVGIIVIWVGIGLLYMNI